MVVGKYSDIVVGVISLVVAVRNNNMVEEETLVVVVENCSSMGEEVT